MASSVGLLDYITVQSPDDVQPPGERTEVVTRPNVDGIAIRKLGKQGDAFRKVAIRDVLLADLVAFKTDVRNQKGSILSFVDDHDITWTNIYVVEATVSEAKKVEASVGGFHDGDNTALMVSVNYVLMDSRVAP